MAKSNPSPPNSLEAKLEFVDADKVRLSYACIICGNPLRPPILQLYCGHRGCGACVEELSQSQDKLCPVGEPECKEVDVSVQGMVFPDFSITKDMKTLAIFCINRKYGCTATFQWSKVAAHLRQCEYVLVFCVYADRGCTEQLPRVHMKTHEENCSYNSYSQCPYCEEQILTIDLKQGHMETCKLNQLQCMLHVIGCTFIGENKHALKMHMEKDAVHEHLILLKKVIDDETLNIEEKIKVDLNGFKEVINVNKKQLIVLSNQLKEMKSKIDPRIKSLQKLTASNAESIIDFTSIMEQYMQVKTIQDKIRNQESRIVALEQNPGGGSSSGSGMSEVLRSEIARIQESVTLQENRLIEYSMRLKALETTSFDGTFIWKIQGYHQLKSDAMSKLMTSTFSAPFYTSKSGYKLCLRLYPAGDGMGEGTHISVYLVVMRGEFDSLLVWPMRHRIKLTLLDQETQRKHIADGFRPDPTSKSFQRPESEANVASGFPLFVLQQVAESSTFLRDDTMFIKAQVYSG